MPQIVQRNSRLVGARRAQIQKPCQEEDHRELGDLRRLNAQRPEANPAMRGMRIIQEKYADQHQHHEAQTP